MKSIWDMDKTEREEHEKIFGGFNDAPPNWAEMTEQEAVGWLTAGPYLREIRQIRKTAAEVPVHATLFFLLNGNGFAFAPDHRNLKVRWFRFARCIHDFKEENAGRCLTKLTCRKCGYTETLDSSD